MKIKLAVVQLMSLGVIVVSGTALCGYMTHARLLYTWNAEIGMAPGTAICLHLLGWTAFVLAGIVERLHKL